MTLARLKLYLLGPPRLELDGRPVQTDTRKATALAAYLAVTGERHSRESLVALFWPDRDASHAHGALRRTLSVLNKATGGAGLLIEREAVELEPAAIWADVFEFSARQAECRTHGHAAAEVCHRCLAPLAQAAGLVRGEFLAGFSLRDSPAFDDWQFFQAEGLRRELAAVLEKLVAGHRAQGEYAEAIAHARRWIALDPLHEPAHVALMQLYAAGAERAAALRQYRELVRVLDAELGVAPLPETTRLHDAIAENRLDFATLPGPAPPSAGPPPAGRAPIPHPRPASAPLVGRTAEWERLLAVYAAIGPDGHWVIIEGEAGIGKTRLAEAWLEQLQRSGAVVLAARCYEGELGLAYSPFVEALRVAAAQPGLSEALARLPDHTRADLARLLPELAGPPGGVPASSAEGPAAQGRFFDAMAQALLAVLAGPRAGVLFFDDFHWADEASLDLLAYLVRRLRGRPYGLLTCWRREQLPARLQQLYLEAARQRTATALLLPRLDRSAVLELVASALPAGGTAGEAEQLGDRLFRESEGLPFLVAEYLAAVAAGDDRQAEWPLSVNARELLASRLKGVSEAHRQLLSAAAVIGRAFDFDTLQAVSGRSEEETVAGLEALVAGGLIREIAGPATGAGIASSGTASSGTASSGTASAGVASSGEASGLLAYDFGHDKLRAMAYGEISLGRRRLLHRRAAEALARQAREAGRARLGPLSAQIAEHYRQGGRPAEAAEHFILAGEHARAVYANREALAHYRAAIALGCPSPARVHEAIADLLVLTGDYPGALASYAGAAASCEPAALGGLEHKVGLVYHRRGDWELAEAHFQAALAALPDGGPDGAAAGARARIYADWSLNAHRQGDTGRARELGEQALQLAETVGDQRALVQAHNILGVLLSSQKDLQQGRHHLARSLALAEQLDDPGARVAALNNLALAAARDDDLTQALQLAETALGLCAALGDRHREAALHNHLADLLHASGRGDEAMAHLKQAVSLFAEIGGKPGEWQPEIWKLTEW